MKSTTVDLTKLGILGVDVMKRGPESRRFFGSIEGPENTWKTTLALQAPGNVGILIGDMNYEGVLEHAQQEKARYGFVVAAVDCVWQPPHNKKTDVNAVAASAKPVWMKYRESFYNFISKKSKLDSIVIETGGYFLNLGRYARFGKLPTYASKVPMQAQAAFNTEYLQMVHAARASGKHVVWVHRVRDEWVDFIIKKDGTKKKLKFPRNTGKLVRIGHKEMGFEMATIISTEREDILSIGDVKGTIVKSTPNRDLLGLELTGEMLSMPRILSMMFPGSKRADWR